MHPSPCVVSNLSSQFLLVSLFPVLPGPSQPLPVKHDVTSRHLYTKCSAVAKPLISVFDQIAPLSVSLWELISYLMNRSSCQSLCSKNFLALPPLLTTLVNLLFSHILHLQQYLSSQRFLCWLLNSPLSCTPSSVELQCHTLVILFIFHFLIRQHVHLCQQTANRSGPNYKDFFTKSLTR